VASYCMLMTAKSLKEMRMMLTPDPCSFLSTCLKPGVHSGN
jgi:hypothetical protein